MTEQSQLEVVSSPADKYVELLQRVQELEARSQASIDLTDDLISQANTVVTAVGNRAAESMQYAELVLAQADTLVGVYLVWATVGVSFISLLVGLFFQKKRSDYMVDASKKLADKILSDEDFRDEFIEHMVGHPNIRENLETAMRKASVEISESKSGYQSSKNLSDDII